jgi:hypothetical protein
MADRPAWARWLRVGIPFSSWAREGGPPSGKLPLLDSLSPVQNSYLLGPLRKGEPPIVSLRWQRVTFIHATWDRYKAAEEINDLFAEGDEFVVRLYHTLRETGMAPERH